MQICEEKEKKKDMKIFILEVLIEPSIIDLRAAITEALFIRMIEITY